MAAAVTIAEYRLYRDQYIGFCTVCQDWTGDGVEPDARKYQCPVCDEQTVYGAEEALMTELVEVEPENEKRTPTRPS